MARAPYRDLAAGPCGIVPAVILAALAGVASAQDAYWALLRDGSEVTAEAVSNWDDKNQPQIAGRALFDRHNPARLVRNMRLKASLTGPRVTFYNGDVLPGRVTGLEPPDDRTERPACLTVLAQEPLRNARTKAAQIAILPRHVKRIVLSGEPRGPYRPGLLLRADGTAVAAQAIRWTKTGVQALTDKGIQTFALTDLAEIHMPAADVIAELLWDALAPCPQADSYIVRLTVVNGAALTFRHAMMVPDRYLLQVQPVWSLDAIRVWRTDLCPMDIRRHDEVPLSLLPAEALEQKSFTGFVWQWRRNRNVRGEALESGSIVCDLGIGTHSYSAVAFVLPTGSRELTFLAGLDRAVGTGGCAVLKVFLDRPGAPGSPPRNTAAGGPQPLWQSGFLRGCDRALRVGPLRFQDAARIVLVTDFGHQGRPAGADPVDIRDEVDWLIPTVRVDAAGLAHYAGNPLRHFFAKTPGMDGWSLAKDDLASSASAAKSPVGARWNTRDKRWEPVLNIPPSGLTLTRSLGVTDGADLLVLGARSEGRALRLTVRADTKPLDCIDGSHYLEVARDDRAQRWSLQGYLGKQISLEVSIRPAEKTSDPTPLERLTLGFEPGPTVVATSTPQPQEWRYTFKKPPDAWTHPQFDDSAWGKARGVFGTKDLKGARTEWKTDDIWLRRGFALKHTRFQKLRLRVIHNDDAEVYLNGELAAKLNGVQAEYTLVPLEAKALEALKVGQNVLAVHCHNGSGDQYVDVGLVDQEEK